MSVAASSEATAKDHAGENLAKLAFMANQIGDFFKAYPEAEAVAAITDHINQFWTKRMREDFRTGFADDASALSPLVRQARDKVRPAPVA
ncbi:formate dehydrogenase subunit delta [Bosea sp. (in: a-proteobacteria)]|uniref:formate dehydrogenase subunit delta n=1 Tax=Bosea sp. (in: a-proteobacteria) TaxID=1871050 RepID=UPI0025BF5951|nr:formate dehydrogenase subunit delta [Bosea sp. (in: a-proteobacteria)]MBR3191051.1 formate dehydrogenase subunit delta [Bosea sp. (in: a-proteobacteria)]